MSDLDALREDFNVAHSTGVEIGKSAVAVIRDLQAENERLREALVLVLDSVEGCHDCWRLMATDDEKAQIRAALEGET